ncbi:hypothetical protein ACJ72_02795 [Emergomyces africanus]|uniref:Heterokaryon incompatibility domain-containing protein n=1 Tax=Emergomyces africanus TaxID=1955775 RepID=A0A1B7P1G1_9EURO|nr:hypothetical protein ACJ72_02795 [Emergomyces africanus]
MSNREPDHDSHSDYKKYPVQTACTLCNKFQGKWDISDTRLRGMNRHHIVPKFTWDEMRNSANSCYCCNILISGSRGCFNQHGMNESDIVHGTLRFHYPTTNNSAERQDSSKDLIFFMKSGRRFEIQIFCTDDDNCPIPDSWDYIPVSRRTSPRTDSDMALATIKGWIASCIVTHYTPECFCDTPDNPPLPTRVVDVGLDDGSVKLIEARGIKAKYICLSHCWGLAQIITTTKSNITEHKRRIPWTSLSKTFRDAISLTRALGFKYIWIDSLCIIQDDAGDWNVESANMAAIYTNGHLTIAATQSANGAGGLYRDTPDFEVTGKTPGPLPDQLDRSDKGGEAYRLFFRERIDHHIDMEVTPNNSFTGNPTATHYPLLTRAWVYQERMLSTRILHFSRYELFFECRSSIFCECDDIEFHGSSPETPIALFKIEHAEALRDYTSSWAEEFQEDIRYQGASLWRTIVSCYTALLLTMSKDRLPAISGIAKDLAARRKSRYLAGVWEESINDDLLWSVHWRSRHQKARPYPRNAPTWSWASTESCVLYWDGVLFTSLEDGQGSLRERKPYTHFSTVQKCEVTWAAVDEFGVISSGVLTISGLVVAGLLEREVEVQQKEGLENIVHYASFPRSNDDEDDNKSRLRLAIKPDYLLDHDGPGQAKPGTEVFCLRMSVIQEGSTDHLISLILRTSSESPGCFERIGTLILKQKPPPIDPVGELFQNAELRVVTII